MMIAAMPLSAGNAAKSLWPFGDTRRPNPASDANQAVYLAASRLWPLVIRAKLA